MSFRAPLLSGYGCRALLVISMIVAGGSLAAPAFGQSDGYWDPRFQEDDFGFSRIVEALAVDPTSDAVYAAGGTNLRDSGRPIVRWTGDGWASIDHAFNGTVFTLAFGSDGMLYAGGDFTTIDGAEMPHVARYDGNSWQALGGGVDGRVTALAVDPASGALYVGGNFDVARQSGGAEVESPDIVRWAGAAWEAVGQGGDGNTVDALAIDPLSSDLFVAGRINPGLRNPDGTLVSVSHVARFDGSTWSAVYDGSVAINGVGAIAFDADGRLYVAHTSTGGLALWDRTSWSMPAGGLGFVAPNGSRSGDSGHSLAIGSERIYVGGAFDFVTQNDARSEFAPGVAAYDPATDRFVALGSGINRSTTAGHRAEAIVVRSQGGDELFIGGVFTEAGARPAANIARWTSEAPFNATDVTFRVDMRAPMRLGLLGGLSYTYPTTRRPMVDVLTGQAADRYILYDLDGDSVWTARTAMPRGSSIDYAYAFDVSGSGFERGTDWVYELDAPEGIGRSIPLTNAPAHTLPVARFDEFPVLAVATDHGYRSDRRFDAGNPGSQTFPPGARSGNVQIDPEHLDRSTQVVVRYYAKDPGGTPPDGLEMVAETAFWATAHSPRSASYSTRITFDYSVVPGVAEPNDLRLLYRAEPESPWQIVPSDIDPVAERIWAVDVTQLAGEWTVGSVSSANALTSDPPPSASNPTPASGAFAAPIRPLLRWDAGVGAQSFDLYLWPSGEGQPLSPLHDDISSPQHLLTSDLTVGVTYNWRIVSRNINGETAGPVWSFTVGSVPDLTSTNVSVPAGGFSGQSIMVDWTVENVGDGGTNVAVWYDDVYLSSSPDLDIRSAARIARFKNLSFLNPGESYANSREVPLPDGVEGEQFVHVVTEGSDVMNEADEANNIASSSLQVTLTPYADLRVDAVAAPANVFSGDSLDVTYTVVNAGTGRSSATSWFDSVFLSYDDTFDYIFASQVGEIRILEEFLGRIERVGALDPGASYTQTIRVGLPDEAIGEVFLFVYTDVAGGNKEPVQGQVHEFNGELDNWTPRSLTSTLTPPPDLVVTSVTPPAAGESGQAVEVQWMVTNQGPGATRADTWRDVIYISPSATFDSTLAQPVGGRARSGVLDPDGSYSATAQVRIPDGVDGQSYFFVATDATEQVYEHTFEANNLSGSAAAASVVRAPYPDLQIVRATVANTEVVAGAAVALTYSIENTGSATVEKPWTDSVYVLTSPSFSTGASAAVIGVEHRAGLVVGAAREQTVAVPIPPDLEGIVYVHVRADASETLFEHPDAEHNEARSGPITVEGYPPVDLVISFDSPPEAGASGRPLAVSITITNAGEGRTLSDRWVDRFYLSADANLDTESDHFLVDRRHGGALDPGSSYSYDEVSLPDDHVGPYFLLVQTDANGDLAESDESNNVAAAELSISLSDPVDLRVTAIEAPGAVEGGRAAVVEWTVTNEGAGTTDAGEWYDALFLSPDGQLDRNDVLLGSRKRQGDLAAGASYTDTMRVSVPAFASGPYVFMVQTDRRDDLYEHLAEGNNVASTETDLVVPAPADLVVSAVTIPPSAMPGEPVTVTWTVTNQGVHPAVGLMREVVFVSDDATWDIEDPVLGVVERDVDLAPGGSMKVGMSVDAARTYRLGKAGEVTDILPGLSPGSYHVVVRTDVANTIRESDETNNTTASNDAMEVDVPVLIPGVPETLTMDEGGARYYRLDAHENQDIRISVTGGSADSGNEIFVALERAPSGRGDYDFAAAEPFTADQSLVIPSTVEGSYFVQVVVRSSPEESETVTLLAEVLGFEVSTVSNDVVGRGRVTIDITGAGFRANDLFLLRNAGVSIEGERVSDDDTSTEISARYILNDAPLGTYDLVVKRSDTEEEAVLSNAVTIEPALPLTVDAVGVLPEAFRAGGTARVRFIIRNSGNVDVPYMDARVRIPNLRDLEVTTSEGLFKRSDGAIDYPADSVLADYFVEDAGMYVVPLLARDLAPGAELSATLLATPGATDKLLYAITTDAYTEEAFVARLISSFHAFRQFVLDDGPSAGTDLLGRAADAEGFVREGLQRFAAIGLLDADVVDAPLSKGGTLAGKPSTTAVVHSTSSSFQAQAESAAPLVLDPRAGAPSLVLAQAQTRQAASAGAQTSHLPSGCFNYIECANFEGCNFGPARPYYDWCWSPPIGDATYCKRNGAQPPNHDPLPVPNEPDPANRPPDSRPTDCGCRPIYTSCDPNDIIGPDGFGDERWVGVSQTLPYTIRFENDPEIATAPAQVVRISHPLDDDVDPRSFRLGEFGFGSFEFAPPDNAGHYRNRLDLSDSLGLLVDVTAGIDVDAREAFWIFTSIDPETGDQPRDNPFAGLLPVNNDSGDGEGFVRYTVRPRPDANTRDEIQALASIIFDINPPIETPPIINTIDADPPESRVERLPWKRDTTAFALEWAGSDEGAGLASYAVYVSVNEGPFEPYVRDVTEQELLFVGEEDVHYRFFSLASDYAGNVEPFKSQADTGTLVPIEKAAEELPAQFALHQNYPNPFNPTTTIPFDLSEPSEVEIAIYDLLGRRVMVLERGDLAAGRYARRVDFSHLASGVYFYEVRMTGQSGTRFRDVKKLVLVR